MLRSSHLASRGVSEEESLSCAELGGFCLEDSNVGSQPGSGCRGGWKETSGLAVLSSLPQNKSACRFIMLLRETLHYKYLSFVPVA